MGRIRTLAAVASAVPAAVGLGLYAVAVGGVNVVRSFTMRWTSRAQYGLLTSMLGRTSIDYEGEVGDGALRNSIVVAVVGWIARNFPEPPIRVARLTGEDEREYIAKGPAGPGAMLKLLEHPNEYFSGALLLKAAIVDRFTTGNAYILKQRNASGRVVGLWWLPKALVRPGWPPDGTTFIGWYEYLVDGGIWYIPRDDVIHLRDGIDPANPRLGLSKLASLFREIYTDDEAANFSARLLTNLGVPGVIIAPSNTSPAGMKVDPEKIKTTFMEKFGGDRRGEPMVLTSPTDVKVLSFSPEQMNLRDLRKIPEERVSAVLGVSAIVAGLGAGLDRSTFTNFGEARQAATEESLIPAWSEVASDFEIQLLPEFVADPSAEYEVEFDLRRVRALSENVDAVWKRSESAATKGLLTRAAFKRAIGETPDAGDEVYVLPSNYVMIPVRGPAPAPPPAGAGRPPALIPAGANGHEPGADLLLTAGTSA